MTRIVPLVIYTDGVKKVVGEARIREDGTIVCTIQSGEIPGLEEHISGTAIEATFHSFSVGYLPAAQELCYNCVKQQCDFGLKFRDCVCCQRGHRI